MKTTTKTLTPFEVAQQQVKDGTLKPPSVSSGGRDIDYFGYQLSVHKYNLGIMAAGMLVRNVKLRDLKNYYGIKGKTAKECLVEFNKVFAKYRMSIGRASVKTDTGEWYMHKIDHTHVLMGNEPKMEGAYPYHVGQLKAQPFYEDLLKWLDGTDASMDCKDYRNAVKAKEVPNA